MSTQIVDANGALHSSQSGRFTGHVHAEADASTLSSPLRSLAFSGRWREREWNDARFSCPVCGRDVGDDYHEWDSEDGTHNVCQPLDRHLTGDGDAILEDDFADLFGVELDADGDLFGWKQVQGVPEHNVWTVLEGDDGNLYATPGVHTVNRLGYITTERPWDDDVPPAQWDIRSSGDDDTEAHVERDAELTAADEGRLAELREAAAAADAAWRQVFGASYTKLHDGRSTARTYNKARAAEEAARATKDAADQALADYESAPRAAAEPR